MTLSIERPSSIEYRIDPVSEAEQLPATEFDAPRRQSFGGEVLERTANGHIPEELQHPDNHTIQLGDAR